MCANSLGGRPLKPTGSAAVALALGAAGDRNAAAFDHAASVLGGGPDGPF